MRKSLKSAVGIMSFVVASELAAEAWGAEPFEPKGFYTISCNVGGQTLALTFIVPPDTTVLTNNASSAKVVLAPLKAGDPSQQWQIHPEKVTPEHSYSIYAKISDHKESLSGVLFVAKADSELAKTDDDKYHDTHNRLTVGPRGGEIKELWTITSAEGGKYKIANGYGVEENLRKEPGPTTYGWHEVRSLEAVKAAGGAKLRHNKPSNAPGQLWTIAPAQ